MSTTGKVKLSPVAKARADGASNPGSRARAKTKKEQKRKVAEEAKDNAALQATLELLRADSFRQTRKRREKEADAPVSEESKEESNRMKQWEAEQQQTHQDDHDKRAKLRSRVIKAEARMKGSDGESAGGGILAMLSTTQSEDKEDAESAAALPGSLKGFMGSLRAVKKWRGAAATGALSDGRKQERKHKLQATTRRGTLLAENSAAISAMAARMSTSSDADTDSDDEQDSEVDKAIAAMTADKDASRPTRSSGNGLLPSAFSQEKDPARPARMSGISWGRPSQEKIRSPRISGISFLSSSSVAQDDDAARPARSSGSSWLSSPKEQDVARPARNSRSSWLSSPKEKDAAHPARISGIGFLYPSVAQDNDAARPARKSGIGFLLQYMNRDRENSGSSRPSTGSSVAPSPSSETPGGNCGHPSDDAGERSVSRSLGRRITAMTTGATRPTKPLSNDESRQGEPRQGARRRSSAFKLSGRQQSSDGPQNGRRRSSAFMLATSLLGLDSEKNPPGAEQRSSGGSILSQINAGAAIAEGINDGAAALRDLGGPDASPVPGDTRGPVVDESVRLSQTLSPTDGRVPLSKVDMDAPAPAYGRVSKSLIAVPPIDTTALNELFPIQDLASPTSDETRQLPGSGDLPTKGPLRSTWHDEDTNHQEEYAHP